MLLILRAGAVLLAVSEWNPSPLSEPSNTHPTATTIPPAMLNACHEILAANARGIGGDLILKVCGLSSALGHSSDDVLLAAAAFAAQHTANAASYALVVRAKYQCIRVLYHHMMARILKRDARRRIRQVGGARGQRCVLLVFVLRSFGSLFVCLILLIVLWRPTVFSGHDCDVAEGRRGRKRFATHKIL